MKAALILVACLAIAQASSFLSLPVPTEPVSEPTEVAINGTLLDLNDYFNGLWAYFNLTQTEAIACFNDVTAEAYFQFQQVNYELVAAFIAANHTGVQELAAQLAVVNLTIYNAIQCEQNTNDYVNLMQAVGANTANHTLQQMLMQIYGQAHMGDWYEAFTPIYNLLDETQYNQAGYAYGPIMTQVYSNASVNNVYYEALKGYQNGIFYQVNVSLPFQLSSCYNETQGQNYITFYYLWAQTVFNSTPENVVANTNAYFNGEGGQLLASIGPVNTCMEQTSDQQALNTAVGYDVHSAAFDTAINNYIANETTSYYTIFKYIYNFFQEYNPEAAGIMYGQFYLNVAASITN